MATCKQTAHEMIHDLFSPCVAIVCGNDVEAICAKNNLSFVEMVQPFCRINTESKSFLDHFSSVCFKFLVCVSMMVQVTIRDPSNVACSIRNFRVVMKDMYCQSPSLPVGKKMMHDAVSGNVPPSGDGILCNSINTDKYQLKFHSATPWFEAYRDVFFQVISPTEHEFVHHFIACIFVVSSSHHDPLSQINDLTQQQTLHQQQNSSHSTRWWFSYVFKYYLLLHDVSCEDLAKAEAIYQSMKSSYGSSSCHLLQINSFYGAEGNTNQHEEMNGISNMPDPWSQFLSKYNIPQDDAVSSKSVNENNYDFPQQNEGVQDIQCDGPSLNDTEKTNFISHPLLCHSEDDSTVNESAAVNLGEEVARSNSVGSGKGLKHSNRNKRHGLCLTASDMDRIRVFVQDFCFQGLVPFVEKQIRILSDQVANRKGLHRTIFGVTKKIFGGNKPGSQSPASSANSVVYSQDAPELQVRKLGDLAFMFQLFEVAYQAYYTARRDFGSDQAWLYAAGASEMAALAVFMQGSTTPHEYPARYMESAITSYLLSCKHPELATRATLLSTECLKAKGLYKEAAVQFIRMPSEADLPSALFLEQAAHCYINCKPPKVRKYAFHIILAGHRFSKAGQRRHALRAYKQAEQVYEDRGWNFANDHINFTAGRLSVYLKQLDSACLAFKSLLATQSQQPAIEQASFLREYLYVLKQLLNQRSPLENYELPCLPLPVINCQATKVLLGEDNIINEDGCLFVKGRGFERADINNSTWARLEEIVIIGTQKCLPPLHSPQLQCLTSNTDNSSQPLVVVKEVITVEVVLKNPLGVAITIDNVFLLWTCISKSDSNEDLSCFSNELEFSKATSLNNIVETEVIPHIVLEPRQEKSLHLILKPQVIGELIINGLAYSLLSQMNYSQNMANSNGTLDASSQRSLSLLSLQGKQVIELKGPRLNRTTAEKTSRIYAADHRLRFHVISPMPKLQVKYQSFPHYLFCGEIQQVNVELSNIGENILNRVIVASPTPGLFAIGSLDSEMDSHWQVYKEMPCNREPSPVMAEWECCDWKVEVQMPQGGPCRLHPGESINLPMWIRGPDTPGEHNLDLLFYYEAEPLHPKLRHRLLQHSSILIAYPSISVSANAMISFCFEEKLARNRPGSSANSILLSVETSNISEEFSSVSIAQVSCISEDWCLCSTDENIKKGMPVIHPREMHHIILKAIGFNTKSTVSSQKVKVFSHVSMSCVEVDSSTTPCSDFSCRSRLNLPDLLSIENVQQSGSSKELEGDRDQSLILLLTVIWKATVQRNGENCVITGQHHIPIEQFSYSTFPNSPITQPIQQTVASAIIENEILNPTVPAVPIDPLMVGSSVKCVLNHPFHVQHNFKHKRLVTVPVEFLAHTTNHIELQIVLDCTSVPVSSQVNNPDDPQSHMPQNFSWVSSSRRVIQLKPYSMVRVPLLAAFASPGTYNLGSMCVTVMDSKGEITSPYVMSPYIIVVNACDLSPQH